MSDLRAVGGVVQASAEATVIRCGCGYPMSHPHAVCPKPLVIDNLGTIAYYNKSRWKMLLFKVKQYLNPRTNFWLRGK